MVHHSKPVSIVISGILYNFASIMEYKYAMYLNAMLRSGKILSWEYEARLFTFDVCDTCLVRGYLPDFKVRWRNGAIEYHETKGIITRRNRIAFDLMSKQYPSVRIVLIMYGSPFFKRIAKAYRNPSVVKGLRRHR